MLKIRLELLGHFFYLLNLRSLAFRVSFLHIFPFSDLSSSTSLFPIHSCWTAEPLSLTFSVDENPIPASYDTNVESDHSVSAQIDSILHDSSPSATKSIDVSATLTHVIDYPVTSLRPTRTKSLSAKFQDYTSLPSCVTKSSRIVTEVTKESYLGPKPARRYSIRPIIHILIFFKFFHAFLLV